MEWLCGNFESHSVTDSSFKPEFETARLINQMISKTQPLLKKDVQTMIDIINEVEDQDHFNGTGWLDYKMHCTSIMIREGFKVTIDKSNRIKLLD